MKLSIQEQNRLANVYRKECQRIISSPFRINWYINLRIKGMSHEKALEKVKNQFPK